MEFREAVTSTSMGAIARPRSEGVGSTRSGRSGSRPSRAPDACAGDRSGLYNGGLVFRPRPVHPQVLEGLAAAATSRPISTRRPAGRSVAGGQAVVSNRITGQPHEGVVVGTKGYRTGWCRRPPADHPDRQLTSRDRPLTEECTGDLAARPRLLRTKNSSTMARVGGSPDGLRRTGEITPDSVDRTAASLHNGCSGPSRAPAPASRTLGRNVGFKFAGCPSRPAGLGVTYAMGC